MQVGGVEPRLLACEVTCRGPWPPGKRKVSDLQSRAHCVAIWAPPPRRLQRARAPPGVFGEGPPRFRRRRGRSRCQKESGVTTLKGGYHYVGETSTFLYTEFIEGGSEYIKRFAAYTTLTPSREVRGS